MTCETTYALEEGSVYELWNHLELAEHSVIFTCRIVINYLFSAVVMSNHLSSSTAVAMERGLSGPSGLLVRSLDMENQQWWNEGASWVGALGCRGRWRGVWMSLAGSWELGQRGPEAEVVWLACTERGPCHWGCCCCHTRATHGTQTDALSPRAAEQYPYDSLLLIYKGLHCA